MRVFIDQSRCCGAGQCVDLAPEVFDQSEDDGLVVLLDPNPPESQWDNVRFAEGQCPAKVIRFED